jgi:hypothetical protein
MRWLYAIVIGFVAAGLVTVVYRFEPNRLMARGLIFMIYLTGTLALWAKIRWNEAFFGDSDAAVRPIIVESQMVAQKNRGPPPIWWYFNIDRPETNFSIATC